MEFSKHLIDAVGRETFLVIRSSAAVIGTSSLYLRGCILSGAV